MELYARIRARFGEFCAQHGYPASDLVTHPGVFRSLQPTERRAIREFLKREGIRLHYDSRLLPEVLDFRRNGFPPGGGLP